jgi:Rrf2 family protein
MTLEAGNRAVPSDRPDRGPKLMPVRISAKTDYALRAMAELAAGGGGRVKGEAIAQAQSIPLRFLLNIMTELRHARIVRSHRGIDGGFELARPAAEVTLAEIVQAVEGSLSTVMDLPPEELWYEGAAEPLRDVWLAVDSALRALLCSVTLADLVLGTHASKLVAASGALQPASG